LRSIEIKPGSAKKPPRNTGTPASAPKILVAEDSPELRAAISLVLLDQGYRIHAARDGEEAVTMFTEFAPDIVVLDMRIPKMSGADVCAAIRQTSDVPIIMFTSSDDAASVKDAILKGATDFILKSSGVAELTERITSHLKKQEPPNRKPPGPKPVVKTAGNGKVPINAAKQTRTTTLIVDPDEETRSVVKSILARLGQRAVEAENGVDAIAAFEKHDPDIVITEWSLPDMDAFNMLSGLKRSRNARQVIKLVMSPRLSPEAQRKANFVGITDFLGKPLRGARADMMVADCVRKAIQNSKRRASKAA
jgi:CheY-like chemotaxis protein